MEELQQNGKHHKEIYKEERERNLFGSIECQKEYFPKNIGKGGYMKHLVRGIKSDAEGKRLARNVFGKSYWDSGVTHYANTKDKRIPSMTKKSFLKMKKSYSYI